MTVAISDETKELLEVQMKKGGFASADEALRAALVMMNHADGQIDSLESLDEQTLNAIYTAEEQAERGEGMPVDEAFSALKRKHFGT